MKKNDSIKYLWAFIVLSLLIGMVIGYLIAMGVSTSGVGAAIGLGTAMKEVKGEEAANVAQNLNALREAGTLEKIHVEDGNVYAVTTSGELVDVTVSPDRIYSANELDTIEEDVNFE